jgi:hypothetical protein
VLLLLENGADPRICDINLERALDFAANKKTENILKNWDIEKTINLLEGNHKKKGLQLFYEYLEMSQEERDKVRYQACDLAK